MDRAGAALLLGGSTDGGADTGVRSTATLTIHHCSHNAPFTQWLQLISRIETEPKPNRSGYNCDSASVRFRFDCNSTARSTSIRVPTSRTYTPIRERVLLRCALNK